MTTEAQIMANRENALRSTGPRCTVVTRFNNLKHGLRAKSNIIPGEDAEEYDSFCVNIREDLKPCDPLQRAIADRIAILLWRLRRAKKAESEVINDNVRLVNPGEESVCWDRILQSSLLEQIARYEVRAIKQVGKLLEQLKDCKENSKLKSKGIDDSSAFALPSDSLADVRGHFY